MTLNLLYLEATGESHLMPALNICPSSLVNYLSAIHFAVRFNEPYIPVGEFLRPVEHSDTLSLLGTVIEDFMY